MELKLTKEIIMKNKTNYLLVSKFKTPDGTVLLSKHRHDYVSHFDTKCNCWFGVDGGISYQKILGDIDKLENLSVYTNDPHKKIRENFEWGSYGKSGKEELHYILLKDLTEEHISAIMRTQKHLPEHILEVFNAELFWRLYN